MAAKLSVVSGGSSEGLAGALAGRLGADLVRSKIDVFEDGESRITVGGGLSGGQTVVVQSVCPPVDTNLVRALMLVSRAAECSERVVAVIPYMGYARQDREFLPGEIVTTRALGRLFRGAGASEIVMVDIHSAAGMGHFEIKSTNVTAVPDLVGYFTRRPGLRDPLVISPDQGGKERTREAAEGAGLGHVALTKDRDRRTGSVEIRTESVSGAVSGRDILLVDDMISTGGSIVKAARFLKGQGCGRIYVGCTHGLLIGGAGGRIMGAGVEEIISSNTVPGRTAVVDVSGAIADAIQQ